MKPKIIITQDTYSYNLLAKITINPKGNFFFNRLAIDKLNVNKTTACFFYQDEEKPDIFYVKLDNKGCCKLRVKENLKVSASAGFFKKSLADRIIKYFKHVGEKSLRFQLLNSIKHHGEDYYPLELDIKSLYSEAEADSKDTYKFSSLNK